MGENGFDPRQFTDPDLRRENSLSENKRDVYVLKASKRASKEEQRKARKDKAEFVRDVIALANAARQRGKPAYLRFGIVDETYEIVGIKGQCVNQNITADRFLQERIHEENQNMITTVMDKFIGPIRPVFYYRPGEVEGQLVFYLEIIPVPLEEPYEVKRELEDVEHSLHVGQCWVRQGASRGEPIEPVQKQFIYAWTQIPYVEKQEWKNYLEKSVNLSGPTTQNITGRQTLYANTGLTLEDEVNRFVIDDSTSLLVISGAAGCGKSAFLRDQFRQFASNLLQELDVESDGLLDFQNPIPSFLWLNSFTIQAGQSFARKLLQRMEGRNELGLYKGEEPEKIFKDESKKWIVFLDAFDETQVDLGNRASLWGAIYEFIDLYPNVQVVLTTRPDASPSRLHQRGKIISINPLTRSQILDFLQAQPSTYTRDQFREIRNFLDTEEDLWWHLQVPLFMSKTAFYLVGSELSITLEGSEPAPTETDNLAEPVSKPNQKSEEDTGIDSTLVRESLKGFVHEQLTDEGEETYEVLELPSEKPIEQPEDFEEKLKMGKFLTRVFEALWEHNQKKVLAGFACGQKDDTFENLGEMAARNPERPSLRKKEVQQYLDGAVYCVLDLGILIQKNKGIQFPTPLSKNFFAAFFIDVLLQTQSPEIEEVVNPPVTFWEKCLQLLDEMTTHDKARFIQQLNNLKGEVING